MKPLCLRQSLHFRRVLFYQQEAWLNNRSLNREKTTWGVCCFFSLSLVFEDISHFKQQVMISNGFSPSFNSLCCRSVNKSSHLPSLWCYLLLYHSFFCHLVVCLSAIILCFSGLSLQPAGLKVKRLKFLCNLKGEKDADRYRHHSPQRRQLFTPDIRCGCLLGYSTNKQFYTGAAGAECTRKIYIYIFNKLTAK